MSRLSEASLAFAEQGRPVFPCSPSTKAPLLPKESAPGAKDGGLYLATTHAAQVADWWRRWPRAMIGMPTGARSGVFVLDLDPKAHEADAMLMAVEDFCGESLGAVPMVRTQSGGLHLWFAHYVSPGEKLGNRANLFGKVEGVGEAIAAHVDTRGDGGYVIVPPSVMESGRAYRWDSGPADVLPPLPARLRALVTRTGEFGPKPLRPLATPLLSPARKQSGATAQRRYAEGALDGARSDMARCAPGSRGATLNALAYRLGRFVAANLLTESEVVSALTDAADACGLTSKDGAREVAAKIRRGLAAGFIEGPVDLSHVGQRGGSFGMRHRGRVDEGLRPYRLLLFPDVAVREAVIADLRGAGALRPTDRAAVLADLAQGRPDERATEVMLLAPDGAWPRAMIESSAKAWASPGRTIRFAQVRAVHAVAA